MWGIAACLQVIYDQFMMALFVIGAFIVVWCVCFGLGGGKAKSSVVTQGSASAESNASESNKNRDDSLSQFVVWRSVSWAVPALAAVAIGLCIYALWGDPGAASLRGVNESLSSPVDPEALSESISILEERVEKRPYDEMSWAYLIRSLSLKQNFPEAVAAHQRAEELGVVSVSADLDAIQSMIALSEGSPTPEIERVMNRVEEQSPSHPVFLELQWLQASLAGHNEEAAFYLESALRQELDEPARQRMKESLWLTRSQLSPERPQIQVEVLITEAKRTAQWLHVFARAAAGQPPVAAVLRPYTGIDVYHVTLDSASAMQPGTSFSSDQPLQVTARLSETPDVARLPSDVERISDWLLPQPHQRLALEFLGTDSAAIVVSVSASPELQLGSQAAVFVVAREIGQGPMPVVAERVPFDALPTRVVLDDSDVMIQGSKLSGRGRLEVFARAATTGRIGGGGGDYQSDTVEVQIGESESVYIYKPVVPDQD